MRNRPGSIDVFKAWANCLLLVALVFAMTTKVHAVNYTGEEIVLGQHLEYFRDADSTLSISDIIQSKTNQPNDWHLNPDPIPNFGYHTDTFWFYTPLQNGRNRPVELLLTLNNPSLDHIDIYLVQDNNITEHIDAGDTKPFDERPIKHHQFLFPLTLAANEGIDVYIKIRNKGAMQVPILLTPPADFYESSQFELAAKHLYYGMMLIMALYNLFLFISVREKVYLYYVGFVASFGLMLISMHGLAYQYFYPNIPHLQELSILLFVPLTVLFACAFSLTFLDLKTHARALYKPIVAIAFVAFLSILGSPLLPYAISTQISVLLAGLTSVLMLIAGPIAWAKGQQSARFYTLGWLLLLLGGASIVLNRFGLIPSTFFTENGLMIGSVLEALMLSFALADRLNAEKKARYNAQKRQLLATQQRVEAEERLVFQSTHNPITELPNKLLLIETIDRHISSSTQFALVKVSLSRFDEVSKTLGQSCSEKILQLFSHRLRIELSCVDTLLPINKQHLIAHYDKTAFCFLVGVKSIAQLQSRLVRLKEALSSAIEYRDMLIDVGARFGASLHPDHSESAIELIRQAHVAMGFSNQENFIYDEKLNPYSEKRLSLMGDLQQAIETNQLTLCFQPQINIKTGETVGAEALVRWNHPTHGYIPPMEFIPDAEESGLIKPLTFWVMNNAMFACREWLSQGRRIEISINISAVNLHEATIVKDVQSLILKHDVPPELVKIEITETAMMLDPERALKVLSELNEIGVKIAVDDFGTGHSSLSYIKQLPAHEIKIDRSFVSDMVSNRDDDVIVSTTINMCHNLGYQVVAEGIEDSDTYDVLKDYACDVAQGYFHSKPLPYEEFSVWLNDQNEEPGSDKKASSS